MTFSTLQRSSCITVTKKNSVDVHQAASHRIALPVSRKSALTRAQMAAQGGVQIDKAEIAHLAPILAGKYGKADPRQAALHEYLVAHSVRPNEQLEGLRLTQLQHPRAGMASPQDSIAILQMMVHLTQARKVIEVGVFTGYTALGFALALPEDGRVIACDITDEYPAIGKPYWKAAGVDHKIDLRIAPAVETLQTLLNEGGEETYDLGFIDADKTSYGEYYELLMRLIRKGGVIVVDNTLWGGRVIDESIQDLDTVAIRKLNDKLMTDERVYLAMLKNSDGMTIAYKK